MKCNEELLLNSKPTGKLNSIKQAVLETSRLKLVVSRAGMWKRLFRQPLPLTLPHLSLQLSITKDEKTTVDNFFNFCGSVACLLIHFIILRRLKPPYIANTLPTSFKLIVPNYSVFPFLDIRTRVECRTVLFNLIVIAQVMHFRVCHGTPINKNLEITNCL